MSQQEYKQETEGLCVVAWYWLGPDEKKKVEDMPKGGIIAEILLAELSESTEWPFWRDVPF